MLSVIMLSVIMLSDKNSFLLNLQFLQILQVRESVHVVVLDGVPLQFDHLQLA